MTIMTFLKKLITTSALLAVIPMAQATTLEQATPVNQAQLVDQAHVEIKANLTLVNEQINLFAKQVFKIDSQEGKLTQESALIADIQSQIGSLTAE